MFMGKTRKILGWARKNGVFGMALVLIGVLGFRSAVADWNDVPTGSMKPTIQIGDRIFVNKLAYDLKVPFTRTRLATWGDPERGDIVILASPADGKRLVKRVVAVPGDVIAMKHGRLSINGEPLAYDTTNPPVEYMEEGVEYFEEDLSGVAHSVAYTTEPSVSRNFGPVELPDGKYFMMGDNRDRSADSRYFGLADRSAIAGRVQGVAFSLDHENHYLPRWSRLLASLD